MSESFDPMSVDWMNFQGPPVTLPKPKLHQPVPEINKLFSVQKTLVKAVNALSEIDDNSREFHILAANLESSYRMINSYLKEHSGGPF